MTTEEVKEVKEATTEPKNTGEVTGSMEEVLEAAQEMQDLSSVCDSGEEAVSGADPQTISSIDDMRYAFYHTSKNLFEAAKSLKPYDIFYTDVLMQQAQYFLSLADNYDTLYSMAQMSSEMPLSKLSSKVPNEVVDQIDDYATAIENRMATLKNKANVSDEIIANVDDIANAIQEKLGKS